MKLISMEIQNYRTLEEINLGFPEFYTAICGKNDSGKTNIVRVIRKTFSDIPRFYFSRFDHELSLKDDFTQWKETKGAQKEINIKLNFEINDNRDAGLYRFIIDYLQLKDYSGSDLKLEIFKVFKGEDETKIIVKAENQEFSGLKAEEILKKLQNSNIFLYHNSTEPKDFSYYGRGYFGSLGEISEDFSEKTKVMNQRINSEIQKIARNHQQQIEQLLGRLDEKYKVAISVPNYDFEDYPYGLTLGDKKIDIPLNEWGSGTQNRTQILLTLFRAHQISNITTSASKITPILIIEEPESFLHPSAQAQFGRVIQDLASEFKIQVIVTTHSPYMLSKKLATSNILLERKIENGQTRRTLLMDTAGENWMEPFGLALSINNHEFKPWKKLFVNGSEKILLVEGPTDQGYFEELRNERHGENRLLFDGEIIPYDGCGNIKNSQLIKFIKNVYELVIVTCDLDMEDEIFGHLECSGFEKKKNFFAIGINSPGLKNIEGLVPERIRSKVYQNNADLVAQATSGDQKEKKSANSNLKVLISSEFLANAKIEANDFIGFYKIISEINKAIKNH
jgi:putative ATP-dependent endonuclease of the OLD family